MLSKLLRDSPEYVRSCLNKCKIQEAPTFLKPKQVIGNHLIFRDARVGDVEFILSLRTDEKKSKYLSYTSPQIEQQIAWLNKYKNDDSQIYFVIENRKNERVGTVRLYDQRSESFCWGSWIKTNDAPPNFGIESALMVYHCALHLGFQKSHFDVRKGNTFVCQFHEKFGATKIGETEQDYFYQIDMAEILKSIERYEKILPNGIEVHFPTYPPDEDAHHG